MRLLSFLPLALLWLAVIVRAAGFHGCCTAFSKVRAVRSIVKRGGAVQCLQQGITEGCSINAVVLKWKRRHVCVNPTPRKMRNLLAILCNRKEERNPRRLQRKRRTKT